MGFEGNLGTVLSCMANASSCNEVNACAECDSRNDQRRCEGDTMVACLYGTWMRRPCGPWGGTCVTEPNGNVWCSTGACSNDGYRYCDGTLLVDCYGNIGSAYEDCADYEDGDCMTLSGNDATCYSAPATSCESLSFQTYCEGNVAVDCNFDGQVEKKDCTQNRYSNSCKSDGYNDSYCQSPTTTGISCDDYRNCVGNLLGICYAGAVVIDCAAMGGRCVDYPSSGDKGCVLP